MNRLVVFVAALALFSSIAQADMKSDILALTSNAQARFAWTRFPWCDSSYNPVQAYKNDNVHGVGPHTQLMAFDTKDGITRYIDSTIGSHFCIRFTRKNGDYVIWNDYVNNCSWIRDYARTQPKRKLLQQSQGDWWVSACGWNPVTDSQYVYLLGNFDGGWSGTSMIRAPLKADYTVDMTKKYTIPIDCSEGVDWHLSASQDGKYMVAEIPQPNIGLINTATGQFLARHYSGDNYGCQQTIAPDNSYRMYHMGDAHTTIRMWDANLSTTMWSVPVNQNLPGNTGTGAIASPDIIETRWSNHPRFFTQCYPGDGTGVRSAIFGMTAAQVKALAPNQAGNFVIGRFSQDFKSVESFALVAGLDVRNRETSGDTWIDSAPVAVERGAVSLARPADRPCIAVHAGGVEVSFSSKTAGTVSLINGAGRVVTQASGAGRAYCALGCEPAGVYVVKVADGAGARAARIMVTR